MTSSTFASDVKEITGLTGTSWNISNLSPNTQYYVRIKAVSSGWESSDYTKPLNTFTSPNAPGNFRSTGKTANSITLSWDKPIGGAASYRLYYSLDAFEYSPITGKNRQWNLVGSTTALTLIHPSLTKNQTYYYKVVAIGAGGAEVSSNVISVMI